MRRSIIVGVVCALLAATGAAFSQTQTFTNFILSAPTGVPTVSDILACVEGSPAKTNQCSVSSIWAVLRSITNIWSGPQEYNPNAFSLNGSTSGQLVINAPATASGTLTFPSGTTNFSATGGTSQVVKQTTSGGPLTVAQLACSDLSNAGAGCSNTTAVSSVAAADSTLTVSPTTGAVTAKVATNGVANANLAQAGANTMKGNWTSGAANESDNAMPSCADTSGNHLNYVNGTGVTCGTSSVTPSTLPFGFGSGNAATAGADNFLGVGVINTTETTSQVPVPFTGHAVGMLVQASAVPGGAASVPVRLRVAGSDTALTCTITAALTGCTDLVHSAAATQGQVMDIKISPTGGAASANYQVTLLLGN